MRIPTHINIIGQKNSGKTTLIQGLIRELTANGLRVGTVKHSSHDHNFDLPGTDSWKHLQAGSRTTIIISPSRFVCHSLNPQPEFVSNQLNNAFEEMDIVLWEGDRNTENDIIECIANGESSILADNKQLAAVVSDSEVTDDTVHFKFDEIERLCGWLMEKYNLAINRN